MLEPNDKAYPTSLAAFRQALSYAIDRQKVSTLGEFNMEPVGNAVGLPSDKANEPYIDKALLKQYPLTYDVAKAKAILKRAGFTWNSSGKLLDPHGKSVALTLLVASGVTDWIAGAEVIQQNLQALGMTVNLKTPSGSTVTNSLVNGSFQLVMGWVNQAPAFLGYNALLNSQFTAPLGKSALSNYERWVDKQTDALLSQYTQAFSLKQQQQIMYKLERIFAQNLPVIPLLHGVAWEEYNTSRLVGWPSASNPFAAFSGPIDDMYIFAQVHKP
ncbi:MAG: hypothetical protein K6T83_09200 [Alicyclobacillus sp.]|nr:hypothetical protein [Alicyclobacillus sp.]